jgi:lipopolysaccharide biosynthesis glycosyltransferase
MEYNICCVINTNYVGQFKVTAYSLVSNNKHLNICIHLLYGNLTEDDINNITKFIDKIGLSIKFYKIDESIFDGLPKMSYDTSYTAYYKVLVPYYLNYLNKVLFLDCDILVKGNIADFYELDRGTFLTCVEDYVISHKKREHVQLITGNKDAKYFNSGVMLFDFKYNDMIIGKEQLINYIKNNLSVIKWHDQDILNCFYWSSCSYVDEKYNYLTVYKKISEFFIRKRTDEIIIVHYANWKPWNNNYIGKCYGLYKKYYKECAKITSLGFLKRRNIFAQIRLILKYL